MQTGRASVAVLLLLLVTSAYSAALLAWATKLTASDRLITNATFFFVLGLSIIFAVRAGEWFAPFLKAFLVYVLLSLILMITALMRSDLPLSLRHVLAAPVEWTGYYPMAGDAAFVVAAPMWAVVSLIVSLFSVTIARFVQQMIDRSGDDDK